MNCQKLSETRMCANENCMAAATCITRVSGFRVAACQRHHDCDARYKPKAEGEGVTRCVK